MAAPSWTLENCCGTLEITFLCLFAGYMVINFLLWNTFVVKPMKLIAVFVHEMSHATACWMTGGSVKGIEVHRNEGGVTKYVGGVRYIVIPAGYLGGAFWGGFFVTLSGDRIASTVSASLFVFALLVALKYSPNGTMVALCLGFIVVTLAFIFIEWFVFSPIIQFVTLYYGVFIGTFSVYDIYDDLITRTVDGSDAKACHELIPCCFPRCVGVQFACVALLFQGLGIYLALVWMGTK
mmetsp:Transcript_37512/g.82126  ORF Transcript_37512/g.82126 Transcript_37512/m.82126 type:complete len:237 (-) Transcript_37512:18-728(-)